MTAGAQETGRAGRDNKVATCIMYYSYGDAQKMRHMLKQSAEENGTSPEQMQHNTDSLNAMVRLCMVLQLASLRSVHSNAANSAKSPHINCMHTVAAHSPQVIQSVTHTTGFNILASAAEDPTQSV